MRLLVADDQSESREEIVGMLRRAGREVTSVDNGVLAHDLLLRGGFHIAIIDWMMAGMDGPALCRALRATDEGRYLYLILLTGRTGTDDVVAGLDAGADEYIAKPCRPQELLARVRAGERIVTLREQLVEANEKLSRLARVDDLTGLPNRRAALERLEQELARSLRDQQPLSVALTDLDRFKQINDTFGHQAGDRALREFASRLTLGTRAYDTVARFGGDEFLVVLPGSPLAQGAAAALRLCESVSRLAFELVPGEPHLVTASFGVTQTEPAGSVTELLTRADEALYLAKSQGGSLVCTRRYGMSETLHPRTDT